MKAKLVAALIAITAVVGCGRSTPTAEPDQTTSTTAAPVSAVVNWVARTVDVEGVDGLTVAFCEGDAPLLCISREADPLGVIELATFPGFDSLAGWAPDFYASIATDRATACGAGYVIDGEDPRPAPFAGEDGIRYGFTGTDDGAVVERVVGHALLRDGTLYVLVANGLADDGCVSRESELPVDVMSAIEPLIAALAAGSTLPA